MIRTREQKGITLVALIITIIVLLILAVVAISAVQDGGIIQHAQNARNEYIIGEAKEKEVLRDYLTKLEEEVSETPYIVHNDTIPLGAKYITHTENGQEVIFESTENNYVKFPQPVKDGDIYIYGDYEYRYNMGFMGVTGDKEGNGDWNTYEEQEGWGVRIRDKRINETSYGPILTTINNKNITSMQVTFWLCSKMSKAPAIPTTVTNMWNTFNKCNSLIIAPKIPEGVTDITGAFQNCELLTTAPDIPNSVTNMYGTFYHCYKLTNVPKIPNSVTNMFGTFSSCTSLVTAPSIPDSVTNMGQTFWGCKSLTGTIVINVTQLNEYEDCFYGTEKPITITSDDGINNKTILDNLDTTTTTAADENNITVDKSNI